MNPESEARFKALWNKQPLEHIANSNKVSLAYEFWCAQEEFWQKKCEGLENYRHLTSVENGHLRNDYKEARLIIGQLKAQISALEKERILLREEILKLNQRDFERARIALDACSPKER